VTAAYHSDTRARFIDIAGKRFGRWTVLKIWPARQHNAVGIYWLCRCECGTEHPVRVHSLFFGRIKSCGCSRPLPWKHGLSGTRAYARWKSMKQRCSNPNHAAYSYYGGRGIGFCERCSKPENYCRDTGNAPAGKSLDRIDVNGNYEPENVRWATAAEQNRNRRPYKRKRHSTLAELQQYADSLARAASAFARGGP